MKYKYKKNIFLSKIRAKNGNKHPKTDKKGIKKERIGVRFVLKLKNVNKLYVYTIIAIRFFTHF